MTDDEKKWSADWNAWADRTGLASRLKAVMCRYENEPINTRLIADVKVAAEVLIEELANQHGDTPPPHNVVIVRGAPTTSSAVWLTAREKYPPPASKCLTIRIQSKGEP
jgi:hypothetical protein